MHCVNLANTGVIPISGVKLQSTTSKKFSFFFLPVFFSSCFSRIKQYILYILQSTITPNIKITKHFICLWEMERKKMVIAKFIATMRIFNMVLDIEFLWELHTFSISNRFISNTKIKQMLTKTQRLNFSYLKIIRIFHPPYHPKIIGHILKNKQKNK